MCCWLWNTNKTGAVASAGYLMGLTKDQFVSAFGIALSQSAGSMQFLTDGAWTKRSHVGQAAQNGLNNGGGRFQRSF